ncbi:MAG: hypothetical protein JO337_06350 [Acidimicrobiales bacterium]|nr:hypothetical protein [Acidimicrobiales bacterium]
MSGGLTRLVPAAQLLAAVAGTPERATALAARLVTSGPAALPGVDDDLHQALRLALAEAGVIGANGSSAGRAAELVSVCEILATAPPPPPAPAKEPRMVFSAPTGVVDLAPHERLDGLVLDVIRCATVELVLGGAFWNEAGFDLLDEVLRPAIEVRRVRTTVIVHPPAPAYSQQLRDWLSALGASGTVNVLWYAAAVRSMMHAKFVVADSRRGYLGTANLTSWGLGAHVEAGVELLPGQCRRLLDFLGSLRTSGLLVAEPPQ